MMKRILSHGIFLLLVIYFKKHLVSFVIKYTSYYFLDPFIPKLTENNLKAELKKSLGESLRLECVFDGVPTPEIQWYKDDIPIIITNDNDTRLQFPDNKHYIYMRFLKPEDEGTYKCEAKNRLGVAEASTILKLSKLLHIKNCFFEIQFL